MADLLNNVEKARLISELSTLDTADFLEIFNGAMSPRKKERSENGEIDDAMAVATCSYSEIDKVSDIELWALPLEGISSVSETQRSIGMTENGSCDKCQSVVVSFSKHAICPVCSETIECT